MPRSLFGRLVLVLIAGLGAALLVSTWIGSSERDRLLFRASGMQLAQRIADISRLLDSLDPGQRRRVVEAFNAPPLAISLDRPPLPAQAPAEGDLRYAMFSNVLGYALGEGLKATVVRAAPGATWGPPPRPPAGGMHMGGGMGRGPGFGMDGPLFVVQVALHDGTRVTFDSALAPVEEAFPRRLAITLAVLLASVVALSLVAVRWITRPLSTLATAAEALGEDINRPPLPETGPTEVRRAARAFNGMQHRLARFINDRTRIFTAMSHDLKTPLTRVKLRAEMLEDAEQRDKLVRDVDEMQSMIAQTLDFMRDATAQEPARPVDVVALLESLQSDYRDAGHELEVRGSAAPIAARPLALRRCFTNLLDNAFRYGRNPVAEVEDRAKELRVTVLDEGPGLPPEQLERAFEPFFRGEASRSRETGGTGLGLGIARNIARAHGGELTLRNREGGGLEALLVVPRT